MVSGAGFRASRAREFQTPGTRKIREPGAGGFCLPEKGLARRYSPAERGKISDAGGEKISDTGAREFQAPG